MKKIHDAIMRAMASDTFGMVGIGISIACGLWLLAGLDNEDDPAAWINLPLAALNFAAAWFNIRIRHDSRVRRAIRHNLVSGTKDAK